MARTAVDASVVVAALLAWHEAHEPAFTALARTIERDELVLPISALIESYSVLTRLPAAHRLSPNDAAGLLESALRESEPVADPERRRLPAFHTRWPRGRRPGRGCSMSRGRGPICEDPSSPRARASSGVPRFL